MMGLDSMAEMRYTDDNGLSGIHHAIVNNHIQLVKILLTQEPDLLFMEVEDNSKNTSLHLIIQSSNTSLLKVVTSFDPDYTIANNLGDTPLHVAVSNSDLKMV